jgi:protein-S-isoprenylcysteine O-methyltransferase Ste14
MELLNVPSAEAFSRWFLAAFFVFVAAFYTVRVLAASRRTGRSPVEFGSPRSRHRAHSNLFRVFRAAILGVCVVRAIWPGIDPLLLPLSILWHPPLLLAGNALLVVSFAAVLYVHSFMSADWRSGIHERERPALITTGPFALSRNPMFMAIQLGQLGLFLSLPSVFTLICLIVGVAVLHSQVRLEERHLSRHHGAAFVAYGERVPRWLRLGSKSDHARPRQPETRTAAGDACRRPGAGA